jgi:hypothetical protein
MNTKADPSSSSSPSSLWHTRKSLVPVSRQLLVQLLQLQTKSSVVPMRFALVTRASQSFDARKVACVVFGALVRINHYVRRSGKGGVVRRRRHRHRHRARARARARKPSLVSASQDLGRTETLIP